MTKNLSDKIQTDQPPNEKSDLGIRMITCMVTDINRYANYELGSM